ncbi:Hydroxyacylglutathione hydrolase [hydrothermal vent metagenome]|uniref:hydroxyacylglutathione hydrolase n=1 Tax=hydrothermal vent metagenome TaxID=652676 RepID=A0A3B0SRJ7_9ZZZZ
MTLQLLTIPCLSDNYAYLLHDPASGETAAVDVPEAGPMIKALENKGWTLSHILLTHHHWDHIEGLDKLLAVAPARVIGAKADANRLPPLDLAVSEGDIFRFGGEDCHILDVSGHTVGHIAFHLPVSKFVFTGDSLMALGCGRVFEGTFPQMWASLCKLAALPADTVVCSGHEYTQANAKFALTVDPGNLALISRAKAVDEARAKGLPTVPSSLQEELETNPFLRAGNAEIQANLGMSGADPRDVFAEIRSRKDRF